MRQTRQPSKYDGGAHGEEITKEEPVSKAPPRYTRAALVVASFCLIAAPATYLFWETFHALNQRVQEIGSAVDRLSTSIFSEKWIKIGNFDPQSAKLVDLNLYYSGRKDIEDILSENKQQLIDRTVTVNPPMTVRTNTALNVRTKPFFGRGNETEWVARIGSGTTVDVTSLTVVGSWVWAKVKFVDK